MSWQLQQAKNRFSEVVDRALGEGPQVVTRHGKPTVVIVSYEEFERVKPRKTLADLIMECPVKGWTIERDQDPGLDRDVHFD